MNVLLTKISKLGRSIKKTITRVTRRRSRTQKLSPNTILRRAQSVENQKQKECIDDILIEFDKLTTKNTPMKYYTSMMNECDALIKFIANAKDKCKSRELCEADVRKIANRYKNIRKYVITVVKEILVNVRYSYEDAREFVQMANKKTEHEIGLQSKTIVSLWINNLLLVSWISKINSNTSSTIVSTNKCKPNYFDNPAVNIGSKFLNVVAKLAELKFAVKKTFNDDSFTELFPKQLQSKQI